MFRKTVALLVSLTLLLLMVSAAAETETGLFGELMESDCADDRLTALDEVAERISVSQTTGDVTVEVCQAYYEGNRIFVSYEVSGPAMVLDGLELEDGGYADIVAGGETNPEEGTTAGWKECIVPEDELADPQTFCLAYRTDGSDEKQLVKFTMKQNAYAQFLQGTSPAADYQAHAILYMGKVDLKGIVMLTSPAQAASWIAWQEGEEGTGTDVIVCWNLYQDGEPVSTDLFGASEALEDDVVFSVMFPVMEDLSGLALVPEYSEGGEKPDEAILLEPMTRE